MFQLKRKKNSENPLDKFQIVSDTCRWCGNGPVIKFEPEQFKVQCWICRRVYDKADTYVGVTKPDSYWINKKLGLGGAKVQI